MGELREKMTRDLQLRGLQPTTCTRYLICVKQFARHFMKSPAGLGSTEVRAFLEHQLITKKLSKSTVRVQWNALMFLYTHTLGRPDVMLGIPKPRKSRRKAPVVLAGTEVRRLLKAFRMLKHRTLATVTYATGLRVNESRHLQVNDVDSRRNVLLIRMGKRGQRYALLGERLLAILRDYYREARPEGVYLFPGARPDRPLSRVAFAEQVTKAARVAGIKKRVTPHTLRHSFATHMMELGTNLREVQVLMGHESIRSTMLYTTVTLERIGKTRSPLEVLDTERGEVLG